jgi:hypothetical protein
MRRGYVSSVALLAIAALIALVLRPVGVEVFNVSSDPAAVVRVVSHSGSSQCVVASDCESVAPANLNLDLGSAAPVLALSAGVIGLLVSARTFRPAGHVYAIPNPPPRSS